MSTPPLPPSGDQNWSSPEPAPDRAERWSRPERAWEGGPLTEPAVAAPHPRGGHAPWFHLLLFVLTLVTMTWAGASFFLNYISAVGVRPVRVTTMVALVGGLWFSVPALLILTAHEFGHYFACRYYRIPATLPYFVPLPFIGYFGTLGAVIRMALPRTRRALFDVGIAGPIAGFVALLPVAWYGVTHSYVVRLPPGLRLGGGLEFGDPLLLTLLQQAFFGTLPERAIFVMHPAGFAAWFGLLATALNLFPAGQLDGGHIVHAVVGRASRYVTLVSVLLMVGLAVFVSLSWAMWTGLIVLMIYAFGLDHPPVADEHLPIGSTRLVLAAFAIVMFALSFTPAPLSPIDMIGGR